MIPRLYDAEHNSRAETTFFVRFLFGIGSTNTPAYNTFFNTIFVCLSLILVMKKQKTLYKKKAAQNLKTCGKKKRKSKIALQQQQRTSHLVCSV